MSRGAAHGPFKEPRERIRLLAGLGVEGDAHLGAKVQHLSRARRDPDLPNLRQVHLIGEELLDELGARGFAVGPGRMGENITTRDVDLLALPVGTRLILGEVAAVELTGLRNPCLQLDGIQPGLMAATLERASDASLIRRCGVMAIVVSTGDVMAGDQITVDPPDGMHRPLEPV